MTKNTSIQTLRAGRFSLTIYFNGQNQRQSYGIAAINGKEAKLNWQQTQILKFIIDAGENGISRDMISRKLDNDKVRDNPGQISVQLNALNKSLEAIGLNQKDGTELIGRFYLNGHDGLTRKELLPGKAAGGHTVYYYARHIA